ncbi:MAG TPA: hypothetical protein VGO90_12665 [Chthoniobacteraceae bacterium]|jgi:hypothetical protein|nr:hypothetical protein [Chthoniobacteraceae bacterium]
MKLPLFRLLSPALAAGLFLGSISQAWSQQPVSTGPIVSVGPDPGTITLRSQQSSAPVTYHGMDKANIMTASGRIATVAEVKPGMPATVYYSKEGNRWIVSKLLIPDIAPAAPGTPGAAPAAGTGVAGAPGAGANATGAAGTTTTGTNTTTTGPAETGGAGAVGATNAGTPIVPGSAGRGEPMATPTVPTRNGPANLTGGETKDLNSATRTDGDRTTQPGSRAATDGDITTQPGTRKPTDPSTRGNRQQSGGQ